jgi:hypothetical protein
METKEGSQEEVELPITSEVELPKTTKEKWENDENIQKWLENRRKEGKEGKESEIWKKTVKIWFGTVEFKTWSNIPNMDGDKEVKKSIARIKRTQPMETWNWRLGPEGELYVNWWCYMRKFIDDHPFLKETDPFVDDPLSLTEEQEKKLEKTRFIYPTLNKWSVSPFLNTKDLLITSVQYMVLVKFAEWLLKLAADRQMFTNENIYNPEIPRIVISGSTKELKLKNKVGKIQSRDASVVYIMQEGSKILSERGFDTGAWEDINKKYTWLLSEK